MVPEVAFVPAILAGMSPWTYAAVGIGTVVLVVLVAVVFVEVFE